MCQVHNRRIPPGQSRLRNGQRIRSCHCDPQKSPRTLKAALGLLGVAGESHLRLLLLELVNNLPVGDVAHLMVFLDDEPLLVANPTLAVRHHRIASIVCLTDYQSIRMLSREDNCSVIPLQLMPRHPSSHSQVSVVRGKRLLPSASDPQTATGSQRWQHSSSNGSICKAGQPEPYPAQNSPPCRNQADRSISRCTCRMLQTERIGRLVTGS